MMGQQKKEMVIPQEIANPKDDIANTQNNYCKVSQDQQAMKAVDQSQSVDKFKVISIKFKVNQTDKLKVSFASSYGLQLQKGQQ